MVVATIPDGEFRSITSRSNLGLPPRQVVCVIGMHRSGTSMITRLVNSVGVVLGSSEDMMAPHPVDNPTGYWESQSIVEFNDRLLDICGGSWDKPPVLADGWEQSAMLQPLRDEARGIVSELARQGDSVGWKDPRMSFLLPFWNTVLPITATVLLHRHPVQVTASLEVRDKMDIEEGAHLWSRYTVAAWRAHSNRAVVAYEHALNNPATTALNLAMFLGHPVPERNVLLEMEKFVDRSLSRHDDANPELGPNMTLAVALNSLLETQQFTLIDRVFDALHEEWLDNLA